MITEIMYHPSPNNSLFEYIELYNPTEQPIDLNGWRVSNGVSFTFENVAIDASEYLAVAADVDTFRQRYPDVENVVGGWTGRLANRGETIEISDAADEIVDQVRYADQGEWAARRLGAPDNGFRGWGWVAAHDGEGSSLELINLELPNEIRSELGGQPVPPEERPAVRTPSQLPKGRPS